MVIDVGKRLMLSGIIIDHKTGNYQHLKLSGKQYHHMCKTYVHKKHREALTNQIDKKMRISRTNESKNQNQNEFHQQPSSRTSDYKEYAEHKLKYFTEAMAAYANEEYTRLNFNQWKQTKRT